MPASGVPTSGAASQSAGGASQSTGGASQSTGGASTPMASGSMAPQSSGLPASLSTTANFPSLSGYPICVSQCLAIAASAANCSSIILADCYCTNSTFADTIVSCTARECYTNIQQSEKIAQQYCDLATNATSLTFPTPPPSPALSSVSSVSIVTGPESTAANAGVVSAPVLDAKQANALLIGVVTALLGSFIGAALI
ncbi:hypothetical protein BJ138DRAFT_1158059 [Hygrophoropsis aurantiaca]|uniref:Uncharacterized protein n=1 Tax=Hygrophoropsis aurantiaca TaxID=72124 RepID=A0ACB8A5A9_9AGAM|nr:hypothetical protein BJ138DRAFT_1158059 [Hygrophoropsis aurantiaca]